MVRNSLDPKYTPVVCGDGSVLYYDADRKLVPEHSSIPVMKFLQQTQKVYMNFMTRTQESMTIRYEQIFYIQPKGVVMKSKGITIVCAKDFHDSRPVRTPWEYPRPFHNGRYIR